MRNSCSEIATFGFDSLFFLRNPHIRNGIADAGSTAMDDDGDNHPTYENGQDIRDRTFAFACRVVRFCQALYNEGGVGRMMVPQLLNCSTSVASMLEEARAAESRRDFISKCCIGLKEAREAHVRLRVCAECRVGPSEDARALLGESNEIVAILGAIVRNTRRNAGIVTAGRSSTRPRQTKFLNPLAGPG
jgi:four helix bundle protein